jgi:4-amino-4-deoxy-L-arabinose transferase-like glycosyltransferase
VSVAQTAGQANNKTDKERGIPKALAAWLVVAFVVALLFAFRVPFDGANPDEPSHIDYIRLLWERRGFVQFQPGDTALFETHQPPLYYLLCVPVYALTGGNGLALRFVNIALQLLTVLVSWRAARDLFPQRREVAVGAAGFVALLPTQAQLAGSVNNDGLTTLICALITWKALRVVQKGPNKQHTLWLGGLLALGLYTKLSVLQMVPFVAICFALSVRAKKATVQEAITRFGAVLLLGFALASPWLIRNTLLYGDPLTLKIYRLTGPNFTPEMMMAQMGWSWGDYFRLVGTRTFATFFYIMPPNALRPEPALLLPTVILALVSVVGALRPAERGGPETGNEARHTRLSLVAVLLLVPFFVAFVSRTFQAQGRYFLPGLLGAALVSAVGWGAMGGRAKRDATVGIMVGILAVLCLYQMARF